MSTVPQKGYGYRKFYLGGNPGKWPSLLQSSNVGVKGTRKTQPLGILDATGTQWNRDLGGDSVKVRRSRVNRFLGFPRVPQGYPRDTPGFPRDTPGFPRDTQGLYFKGIRANV